MSGVIVDHTNSLVQAIIAGANSEHKVKDAQSTEEGLPWTDMFDGASKIAAALELQGFGPGSHIGLLAFTSIKTIMVIEGIWLAGACVVVLPVATRAMSNEGQEEIASRALAASLDCIIVAPHLKSATERAAIKVTIIALDELLKNADHHSGHWVPPHIEPGQAAVLQFTSGSTEDARGVILSQANVLANIRSISKALQIDPGMDCLYSWLPLFHDMGLFGFLALPMLTGTKLVVTDPSTFLADPGSWMNGMSRFGATHSAGPNFAYAMALRRLPNAERLNLTAIRWLLNASEPIDPAVVRQLEKEGGEHGLATSAICSGYGLAEATLAVTLVRPGEGVRMETVSGHALEVMGRAIRCDPGASGSRETVALGGPVPSMDLKILGTDGGQLDEREVGSICIKGPSVSSGYYRNTVASMELFRSGWLDTGDVGYVADGQLIVCGRSRDIVIIGGRNFYPFDIERIIGRIPGIRAGHVMAISVKDARGRERLGVVAECTTERRSELRESIRKQIFTHFGVRVAQVDLKEPGVLPKTSSGKLRRAPFRRSFGY